MFQEQQQQKQHQKQYHRSMSNLLRIICFYKTIKIVLCFSGIRGINRTFSTCFLVPDRHTGGHVFTDNYFTKTQTIPAYCSTDCSNHGDVVDSFVAAKDAGFDIKG